MHILYIHQYFSTRSGAAGTRSLEFASALIKAGHEVTVVCGTSETTSLGGVPTRPTRIPGVRAAEIHGINVRIISLAYSNSMGLARRAYLFLKFAALSSLLALVTHYDLVFATSTPLTTAFPGILGKCLRGKPFVFEVRDLWPDLPIAMGLISNSVLIRILRWLERTAYTMANHIVILAPGMGTTLNALGVADAKVTLIPNGCDLELFRPTRRAPPSALPGIAATDITAVFTGAHGLANGLTQLIEVAARMSKLNSHLKFVFIGSGSQKPLLVQQATRAGLGNCLFFPPMPKSQLAELLPSFDIGLVFLAPVSAFYYGTSPNKFFDYLSAGIPIVVNHPGWVADLVTASHCGFSAPPSDTDAVVQSLLTLAENPELRHSMGRNARLLGEERFDRLELCKQFVNTIEDTYRLSLGATQ